jgi:hypothetical protein
MNKMDFILNCKMVPDGNNWQYICKLLPSSTKAKEEYGNCIVATMILEKDVDTLKFLGTQFKSWYNINAENTIVFDFIQRHDDCDKDKQIRNLLALLLCGVLDDLKITRGIDCEYIYLFALHPKLIKLYSKYGFKSINDDDSRNMIASIKDISIACVNAPKLSVLSTE